MLLLSASFAFLHYESNQTLTEYARIMGLLRAELLLLAMALCASLMARGFGA